ncbi:dihydroxyacetone kinase DhaL subunit [Actinocorallia herbida]|uniref:Dihydroxyacetone kinase DhaL subunit n=1 Tax=Actinocorallia herbida TaxID=58109 RepID=A0A3N1CZF6_9ACTN|nr:DAK2 domain-containing protein [Actinocorallia herbida]ROO86168.1 dihydroxyacetone kinase DhaL subunit [Actinocorallia herbida]
MTGSADVLRRFREAAHEAHPALTELDRLAGDGDFGDNLTTGLDLAVARLDGSPDDGRDAFTVAAEVFLDEVGGTSGPLFGLLFQELGRAGETGAGWPEGAADGLAAIQRVGEARVGDRTMVDALSPAVESLRVGGSPTEAAQAARTGARATADLRARMGRASYVGDRAQGHPDPGAVGIALLFWSRAAAESPSPDLPDLRSFIAP